MADKLVALLGPGEGPRMYTGRMRNLVAKIIGLHNGHVEIAHDSGLLTVEASGEVAVPDSEWMQFHHVGKSRTLICTIQSKANALPSAQSS
jgi:hypothetical protein